MCFLKVITAIYCLISILDGQTLRFGNTQGSNMVLQQSPQKSQGKYLPITFCQIDMIISK